MSSLQRRFEILLPLRFNDGKAVPDDLIADTLLELEKRFHAISSETQIIHGLWEHEGHTYRDDLVRVFVDVADTKANRRFFVRFKKELKASASSILDLWVRGRVGTPARTPCFAGLLTRPLGPGRLRRAVLPTYATHL